MKTGVCQKSSRSKTQGHGTGVQTGGKGMRRGREERGCSPAGCDGGSGKGTSTENLRRLAEGLGRGGPTLFPGDE